MHLQQLSPALLLAATLACAPAYAQFAGLDTRLVASGFTQPVFATAPLADGRVFVVEQGGRIKSVLGGVTSTFLSLPVGVGGEQGLLGLAFDPQYGVAGSEEFNCSASEFWVNISVKSIQK